MILTPPDSSFAEGSNVDAHAPDVMGMLCCLLTVGTVPPNENTFDCARQYLMGLSERAPRQVCQYVSGGFGSARRRVGLARFMLCLPRCHFSHLAQGKTQPVEIINLECLWRLHSHIAFTKYRSGGPRGAPRQMIETFNIILDYILTNSPVASCTAGSGF